MCVHKILHAAPPHYPIVALLYCFVNLPSRYLALALHSFIVVLTRHYFTFTLARHRFTLSRYRAVALALHFIPIRHDTLRHAASCFIESLSLYVAAAEPAYCTAAPHPDISHCDISLHIVSHLDICLSRLFPKRKNRSASLASMLPVLPVQHSPSASVPSAFPIAIPPALPLDFSF